MRTRLAWLLLPVLLAGAAMAQEAPAQGDDFHLLLARLEAQAEAARQDLARLEVGRWRGSTQQKREALAQADSLERNLREALPHLVAAAREAPGGMAAGFRLYRNLDALHYVMEELARSTAGLGARGEAQVLAERARFFAEARRALGERLEALAEASDAELASRRAAERAAPPKKIIVDQEKPPPRKR
jgi:hypothetical protein